MKQQPAILRVFGYLARCLFALLLIFTSFYSVLAYIPDTYHAFIQAPFMGWIPGLIGLQPFLYALLAASVSVSLWMEKDSDSLSTRLVLEFMIAAALVSIYLIIARPYSSLHNDSHSFVLALGAIFPILWIGILDCRVYWHRRDWTATATPRFGIALLLSSALAVAIVYPAAAYLRFWSAGTPLPPIGRVDLLAWSGAVFAQVLLFSLVIGLLIFCESLASRARDPLKVRFVSFAGVAWLTLAAVMERVAFGAIPFHGTESLVYSWYFGLAGVVFAGGLVLRGVSQPSQELQAVPQRRHPAETALLALVLLGAACVVPAIIGLIDWNSIMEKTWVLVLWTASVFILMRVLPRPKRAIHPLVAIILPILAYCVSAFGFQPQQWTSQESALSNAINAHSSYDVSYVVARDLLATTSKQPCDDQCNYLHEQTNIPPAMLSSAPELDLVDHLQQAKGKLPDIYVLVIDSLRQDFVTAYNPAVDYTPEIAAFAKDSLVFHNAFTRYAGTTLSEPAIWAGAMLLHAHFVQPFSRVNNLEKLVVADGYQPFVTVDTTLHSLLSPQTDLVPLDDHADKWTDVDLCSTVDDVEQKILRRTDPVRPIFMFTQPQNVHLLTVHKRHADLILNTREQMERAYAQDLRRMDGCFGRFVRFLKSKGRYDNSIIVLTADHGEFGQGAHTTSIEPDVLKVPLIIHVPERVRRTYYYDTSKLIFTTDITPTLYYLLGHRPIRNSEILGRPMITETSEESAQYERPSYLVAASYAPNYGILSNNGRMLFAFDDYKHEEGLYDLSSDPHGDHNLITPQVAQVDDKEIRNHLAQIAKAYNFQYRPLTLVGWLMH
ncbi:MAG TPA: sulfatase-like hydrolase/transferase [Candidatus Angelobacter sp.]|jgi:arylsulfatase A-like enzyme